MANKCVEGKVIVVTGAGRGIGREISLLAAAEGGVWTGLAMVVLLGVVGWRALRTDEVALAVYVALLPFLLLDHFAYSLPQGMVILAVWLGFLDGWYADRRTVSQDLGVFPT